MRVSLIMYIRVCDKKLDYAKIYLYYWRKYPDLQCVDSMKNIVDHHLFSSSLAKIMRKTVWVPVLSSLVTPSSISIL